MNVTPAASEPAARPVFVLSTVRSGSTLLRYCLDTHPEVFCPPELHLGEAATHFYRVHAGLAGEGLGIALGAPLDPRVIAGHPDLLAKVGSQLGALMAEATRHAGKRVWCEKSPSNLRHLALLNALFPHARYLCLYRGCLDVVHSVLELCRHGFILEMESYVHQSPRNLIRAAVNFWIDEVTLQLSCERRWADRCHRLRYEDLVRNPEQELRAVFAFLGLAWHDGLLEQVFRTSHGQGIGDPKVEFSQRIHSESVGAGAGLPLTRVPGPLLVRMNTLMAELGYGGEESSTPAAAPPAAAFTDDLEADAAGAAPSPLRQFFAELPARVRGQDDLLGALDSTFKFVAGGDGGGEWVLDCRGGGCRVIEGGAEAAYSLILSASDLLAIVQGRLNAMAAGMSGRIRVTGEPAVDDLQRLVRLLHQAAA